MGREGGDVWEMRNSYAIKNLSIAYEVLSHCDAFDLKMRVRNLLEDELKKVETETDGIKPDPMDEPKPNPDDEIPF